MPNWDLIFDTFFDIVSTSTGIDRRNVDFDTDRLSHRPRKYCEIRWDIIPAVEEPEEEIVDEDAVVIIRHQFAITYLFVSDRHVSRADLAQVSAHRLITATATEEVRSLLASVGASFLNWSNVVDGPDLVIDQRRVSTATVTGTYGFAFCEPLVDLGLTDPGYFDRVDIDTIPRRIVSPGALPDDFTWAHLWAGGATDLVRGWHFATGEDGVAFNVNGEISLSPGVGVSDLNSQDVGQVLDGFSFAIAATFGDGGPVIGRTAGGVGWEVSTSGTDVLVTINAEPPVVIPGAVGTGLQVIALGGVGQDVRVVGPGVDQTVALASERRVITALSLHGGTVTTVPLMGFAATDPETLRNHVLSVS